MTNTIELPLFPLNTVLFPGGLLPLKIFEQRYVEMTKRCLRDDSAFGVCLIRDGREVGDPAVPALLGTTARILQWDLPHPNLFQMIVRGEERFRILRSEVVALGLTVGEVEMLPAEEQPGAPDTLCRDILAGVIQRIGAERFGGAPQLHDAAWVSYRLAEILPLPMAVRQQLLETDAAQGRLDALKAILSGAERPT